MRKLCFVALLTLGSRAFAACPSQPPQLVAPSNGATNVASPVLFDWNDVPGANAYRLWASFNGGTPNIIALTNDSEYTIDVPSGTIDWWVDALGDSTCTTSMTSTHFHFTAVGDTATCSQNPGAPTLVTPALGASNLSSPIALSWTGVPGATGYRVFVGLNGTPAALVSTTAATQLSLPLPQGSILWFVEAQFTNCPSTFSRFGNFTITTGASCSTESGTTLMSPANGATITTSPVTFQWMTVPGSIGYKLYIGTDLVATTTDTSATRLVGNGPITWRVDTMYVGCPDVPSQQFTFTVPVPSCSGSISLTAPADNSSVNSPVPLAWTAVSNTTAYRIWVSVDGGPPSIVNRTGNTSQTQALPSGAIDWYVEALFASCPSVFSPHGHFTVSRGNACGGNQAPALTSPLGGTQPAGPVTFNWNGVNGALLYRVWAASDGDPFQDIGVTKSTSLQQDVGTGAIQWYVEALFAGCPAVASTTASFTIPSAGCDNDATLLLSPANGAGATAPVTMVWSAVQNATEYRVWSKDANGKNVVIAKTGGDTTSITKDIVPGSTEWWVESDFDQCPGTKSTHSIFTIARAANCATDIPALVAPADGAATVASPVLLDWDPVSGAVGYAVLIRHNGGAQTVLGATQNSELTRRLPDGAFEWWVVAFFAACPPVTSQHRTFTIPASACSNRQPILMTPVDGATGLSSNVHFSWSTVPKATSYKIWASDDDDAQASVLTTTASNKTTLQMPAGAIDWYVEAIVPNCPSVTSATSGFAVRKNAPACSTPNRPVAKAPGQVASGTPFTINWNAVANATNYELQESTTASFGNATTQVVADTTTTLTRTAATQPQRYFYRVRAVSNCSDDHSAYSKIVSVVVIPPQRKTTSADVSVQNGITQQIALPAQNPPATFSARSDKPYITVSPASGTVGPQGTTLTVTFDPSTMKLGTNTGTVIVTYGTSGPIKTDAVTPVFPVSVSLVTPVAPGGKNTPPPDSLIVPAVGHAPGANNSMFESDVRVANTSAQTQKYQLNFTLTGSDGTQSGQSTLIEINPGDTMALDDIMSNFFGIGSDGSSATGVLEIRPLTATDTSGTTSSTPSVQTVASSRTFDTTANGTFGQFIPAIPFSQFIGQGSRLSLQQVAQSAAYRTNIGLVEAAGEPASVLLHVFNDTGTEVATIPQNLLPSEQLQLNSILPSMTDGRIEVEVTSTTGKVTAYASVVDNVTNDPLLVSPVLKGGENAQSYTLPGVGDFDIGIAHWKSDVRVFNSGATSAPVTLSYFPQSGTAPQPVTKSIAANTVLALDNLIASTWPGLTQTAGSLQVTTASASTLVTTARTYTQTTSGTYGQFIPGVTAADSIGNGDQALQILQLESSSNYRTNIGVAETSGNAATAHVSLILPDSKFAISTDIPLSANQFVQFPLSSFGVSTLYNGRVTVSVTGGSGRVTAYGSVIDQTTQDPTYVPAQ